MTDFAAILRNVNHASSIERLSDAVRAADNASLTGAQRGEVNDAAERRRQWFLRLARAI